VCDQCAHMVASVMYTTFLRIIIHLRYFGHIMRSDGPVNEVVGWGARVHWGRAWITEGGTTEGELACLHQRHLHEFI